MVPRWCGERCAMQNEIAGRDWQIDFDLDDPAYGDVFHEVADQLVARCPVAHSRAGYYVINRYDDILHVLQDWQTFSSADGIIGAVRAPEQPLFKPNETDPPEHTQLRGALTRFFTAAAVLQHEPGIRMIADRLLDAFVAAGEVDVVKQYADPLPPIAFCQVVAHMPAEDMDFLQQVFTDAITGPLETRGVNWVKGQDYLAALLERRKHEPRQDDIVDAILHFEFPDGRPFSHSERAGSLAQIVAAGATTTGAVIAGALYHLATHVEDRRRLQADHSLIPRAVEEFLRVYVSPPNNGRRVMRDVEIAGTLLRGPHDGEKGDYIIYNLGAANRDPSMFSDPGQTDITRTPNRHLSFAAGTHRCLGLHLARLNLRIAIEAFITRIEDFSLARGFVPRYLGGITRSLRELPLKFEPRHVE
jgi:cytochrome P450